MKSLTRHCEVLPCGREGIASRSAGVSMSGTASGQSMKAGDDSLAINCLAPSASAELSERGKSRRCEEGGNTQRVVAFAITRCDHGGSRASLFVAKRVKCRRADVWLVTQHDDDALEWIDAVLDSNHSRSDRAAHTFGPRDINDNFQGKTRQYFATFAFDCTQNDDDGAKSCGQRNDGGMAQ